MPFHLILLVLSLVQFFLAGALDWPRANTPASYGHPLGWFAGCALAASFLVAP